ncbi:MAG: TonB-dependent receptor, partial [Haliea sp.]|nr:TonB-dependent receptor [Haliea sp.]
MKTTAPHRASALYIAIVTATATMFGAQAHAQLEEVIVTAQKRAESVQDVPIAITAFDESALRDKQINGFADMRVSAPNVSY